MRCDWFSDAGNPFCQYFMSMFEWNLHWINARYWLAVCIVCRMKCVTLNKKILKSNHTNDIWLFSVIVRNRKRCFVFTNSRRNAMGFVGDLLDIRRTFSLTTIWIWLAIEWIRIHIRMVKGYRLTSHNISNFRFQLQRNTMIKQNELIIIITFDAIW